MKANEFRVSNWINEYGIARQIMPMDIVGLHQIEQAQKVCIDLTPIPLTEKWLLKFGLEGGVFPDIEYYSIKQSYNGDYYCLYFDNSYTATDIKYVHQLQNLYFALTGEELTIKS